MEFPKERYEEVFSFLNNELVSGKKWLVYNQSSGIGSPRDIHCFLKASDAGQYAHDNTSPYDIMSTSSIKNFLKTIKKSNMNTQNLEFLQINLKYFGFGDKVNDALEKNIRAQKPEFQLKIEVPHFNNKMDYTLHFKKSDSTDMYFFNRYDAALQNGKPGEDKSQSFYINKGNGITAKEAFNLLEGRSVYKDLVNKEGEKYSAWLKLDFQNTDDKGNYKLKQFNDQYGFNLEKVLKNFPIKELSDAEQKKQLLSSLQKGNAQQVTMTKDGKDSKYFIEAVPQFKNINVYDQKMHVIKRQNVQQENGQSLSETKKIEKKQEKNIASDDAPRQKQSRKRKLTI